MFTKINYKTPPGVVADIQLFTFFCIAYFSYKARTFLRCGYCFYKY